MDKKDAVLRNSGDMVVPWNDVTWTFEAENTETVSLRLGPIWKPQTNATPSSGINLKLPNACFKTQVIPFTCLSQKLPKADSMTYMITVIPDAHPTISVEQRDSTDAN